MHANNRKARMPAKKFNLLVSRTVWSQLSTQDWRYKCLWNFVLSFADGASHHCLHTLPIMVLYILCYGAPSTALLRLELQLSLFSLCLASCLISVSKSVEYTSTIIQLLNLSLDNLWQHMQKISKYSVVTQRIGPLFGLAAYKHFNTGAALRSTANAKLCPHILAPAVALS